jgi:hypothetical protein
MLILANTPLNEGVLLSKLRELVTLLMEAEDSITNFNELEMFPIKECRSDVLLYH